jgi:hypothetical protein
MVPDRDWVRRVASLVDKNGECDTPGAKGSPAHGVSRRSARGRGWRVAVLEAGLRGCAEGMPEPPPTELVSKGRSRSAHDGANHGRRWSATNRLVTTWYGEANEAYKSVFCCDYM